MEKKITLTLDKEFTQYCELNNIKDVNKLATETFKRGFSILKYGETPFGTMKEVEKTVEVIKEVEVIKVVEKIVEVIKEVPVEVIREIIKEVPVEVIKQVKGKTIKSKPIEIIKEVIKEVEVVNNEKINELMAENEKLKKDLDTITKSLTKGRYIKNSNLDTLYGE